MKRLLGTAFLLVLTSLAFAQSNADLYRSKYSYDLKKDGISVKFQDKTYWLRMSVLKDGVLTLGFFLKGDTPTTTRDFLTILREQPSTKFEDFSELVVSRTRPKAPMPLDIFDFSGFQGGHQRLIGALLEDPSNNLVEDTEMLLRQLEGQPVVAFVHTLRAKLSEVRANPDLATTKIGDRREDRLHALADLQFQF